MISNFTNNIITTLGCTKCIIFLLFLSGCTFHEENGSTRHAHNTHQVSSFSDFIAQIKKLENSESQSKKNSESLQIEKVSKDLHSTQQTKDNTTTNQPNRLSPVTRCYQAYLKSKSTLPKKEPIQIKKNEIIVRDNSSKNVKRLSVQEVKKIIKQNNENTLQLKLDNSKDSAKKEKLEENKSGVFRKIFSKANKSKGPEYSDQVQTQEKLKNYKHLLLRYGVTDNYNENFIHSPKYISMMSNPKILRGEMQKLNEALQNEASVKQIISKKSSRLASQLISIHDKHNILEDSQIKLLHNVKSIDGKGNLDLDITNLDKIDKIVQDLPILTPNDLKVTSYFGPRRISKDKFRLHAGVDLVNHKTRMIHASASGIVETAERRGAYGNLVVIKHAKCKTKYAHLAKFYVAKGDVVTQGDLIGEEGATGRARGKHLHMEVLVNNKPVDPIDFIQYSLGNDYKEQRQQVLNKCPMAQLVRYKPSGATTSKPNIQKKQNAYTNKVRKAISKKIIRKKSLCNFVKR